MKVAVKVAVEVEEAVAVEVEMEEVVTVEVTVGNSSGVVVEY